MTNFLLRKEALKNNGTLRTLWMSEGIPISQETESKFTVCSPTQKIIGSVSALSGKPDIILFDPTHSEVQFEATHSQKNVKYFLGSTEAFELPFPKGGEWTLKVRSKANISVDIRALQDSLVCGGIHDDPRIVRMGKVTNLQALEANYRKWLPGKISNLDFIKYTEEYQQAVQKSTTEKVSSYDISADIGNITVMFII